MNNPFDNLTETDYKMYSEQLQEWAQDHFTDVTNISSTILNVIDDIVKNNKQTYEEVENRIMSIYSVSDNGQDSSWKQVFEDMVMYPLLEVKSKGMTGGDKLSILMFERYYI